jgi:serine/threonine protein kinase
MGEVFVCLDQDTRRQVALKRMLPQTAADAKRRARFVEEAQVTAQLEHPNIVPVYELGQDEQGNAYYTMKLVRGRSLADILKQMKEASAGKTALPPEGSPFTRTFGRVGPSPAPKPSEYPPEGIGTFGREPSSLSELLQIFLKVCDAVGFAHSKGVLHRDLKPDNVMAGDFGEVLVMDWGLAKVQGRQDGSAADLVTSSRAEAGVAATIDGTTVGTPAYMAPEQATGRMSEVGPCSDIYSLGAILYEILARVRAVDEPTPAATLRKVAAGQIVPPEQRAPSRHVPRELSAVVMKCMAKAPSSRYGSVAELRKDVSLFLEGRSVSAAPDTFAQSLVKLVKRNKAISAAIAVSMAILVVVTVAYLRDLRHQRDEANRARGVAVEERKAAEKARDNERKIALTASKGFADEAVRAAEMGSWEAAERRAKDADDVALNSPWGAYARGVFARMRNDYTAAAGLFREASQADPHHPCPEAEAALSEAQARLRALEDAERLAANVGQMTDWRELLRLGQTLHDAARWKDCQVPLQRAVEWLEKERQALPAQPAERSRELLLTVEGARYTLDAARARVACVGFDALVRTLPAEDQVRRVQAKLSAINGIEVQVGGIVIANGQWVEANLAHQDQPSVRFLYPFQGVPLSKLNIRGTGVRDLSQLRGLPLTWLDCGNTPVRDLSPLKGLPLRSLFIACDYVTDLTPLAGMDLELLCFRPRNVQKGIGVIRGMRSLKKIGDRWETLASPEEFWRRYDGGQ